MIKTEFGKNLKEIRKKQGLLQKELGQMAGISTRMIAHYENWAGCPPIEKILKLADALNISIDSMLGRKKIKSSEVNAPKNPRIWNKLKQVEKLPRLKQKAILTMIDSLLKK